MGTRVIYPGTNIDFQVLVTNGTRVPMAGAAIAMCPGWPLVTVYRGTYLLCANNRPLPTYKFWSEAEYPNTMGTIEDRVEVGRRGRIELLAQGFDALHRRVALKYEQVESERTRVSEMPQTKQY